MNEKDEKSKAKPICADCRKMEHGTRICQEMALKVKRTDTPCNKFVSANPRYQDA